MEKRLATEEETKETLKQEQLKHPAADVSALHQEAIGEGYKDEVCPKCGAIFLAHHHLLDCPDRDCPMKGNDGKSILEMLLEELS